MVLLVSPTQNAGSIPAGTTIENKESGFDSFLGLRKMA